MWWQYNTLIHILLWHYFSRSWLHLMRGMPSPHTPSAPHAPAHHTAQVWFLSLTPIFFFRMVVLCGTRVCPVTRHLCILLSGVVSLSPPPPQPPGQEKVLSWHRIWLPLVPLLPKCIAFALICGFVRSWVDCDLFSRGGFLASCWLTIAGPELDRWAMVLAIVERQI
jgi:hypothetical protein